MTADLHAQHLGVEIHRLGCVSMKQARRVKRVSETGMHVHSLLAVLTRARAHYSPRLPTRNTQCKGRYLIVPSPLPLPPLPAAGAADAIVICVFVSNETKEEVA